MTYIKICIAIFSLLTFSGQLSAQKKQKASGEYIFYVPETMSLEQARHIALERAKIQILAEKYGTTMDATSASVIKNENGNSTINSQTYSKSLVKGEWLETLDTPDYSIMYEDGLLAIRVRVTGIVREITSSKINVRAKILRNDIDDRNEDTNFTEGDDMYLSFQAPVDGYLTVYLYDGDCSVYRLLPYRSQPQPSVKIVEGKRYVFFNSKETLGIPAEHVDEYVITCTKDIEINRIYIIFSPNKFTKAIDCIGNGTTPSMLSLDSFNNWLSDCRILDKDMIVLTKDIVINNNILKSRKI